jgi:hypothetical protein
MENILLLVLVVPSLVAGLICLSLMIHTPNKTPNLGRPDVFLPAWEWFQSGPIQRLMPGGAIIVVMTRWSKLDLTGQIVNQMVKNDGVDDWEVVEFPAIIEDKEGNEASLWPEFWPLEELQAKKAALDVRYWNCAILTEPSLRRRCSH